MYETPTGGATQVHYSAQLPSKRRRVRLAVMALTQHLRSIQHAGFVSTLFKETQRRGCLALAKAHQSTSTDSDHPRILITGKSLILFEFLAVMCVFASIVVLK